MKVALGWWWPNDEWEAIQWMENPKNKCPINGRDSYQGKKQLAAMKHCRTFSTAIDVGGHVGLWSFNLAKRFENVVAFEPVALHRQCFYENVKDHNVDLRPWALGAVPGKCDIVSRPGVSGDSQVRPGTSVEMRRLDDEVFVAPISFIKVDCEGYEENVVLGGMSLIAKYRPVICVEQKRDMARRFGLEPQGAVHLLQKNGYKIAEEIGGDYIMVPT